MYRYYGSSLAGIGLAMFLTSGIIVTLWWIDPLRFLRLYFDPLNYVILAFLPLGFILMCIGEIIRIKFREWGLFLIKDGGPIHSGKPWYEGSESGLFLTSCGLVVSINEESEATAHVGYRIIQTKHATHRDCVVNEGSEVLDKYAHGRAY
jgi:hypothetical protein